MNGPERKIFRLLDLEGLTRTPKPRNQNAVYYSKNGLVKRKRMDTSLGRLTQNFMRLLMKAPGFRLDLTEAAKALGASKRRLYDVIAVLAGAGLLTKPDRSVVAWNDFEALEEFRRARNEVAALLEVENQIDREIGYIKCIINKMIAFDEAYVTKEDIATMYKDKTAVFVRGPKDTDLLVPKMSDGYIFSLKSPSDPIDVFLFSDTEEDDGATMETHAASTESFEVEKTFAERPPSSLAVTEVNNSQVENTKNSCFSDSASVLLRGLYPGPFQESELMPRKTKKHAVNFIPLEPVNNQNKPLIASYRADSAAFRAPRKKLRIS